MISYSYNWFDQNSNSHLKKKRGHPIDGPVSYSWTASLGTIMMFDNLRILHGRSAIDPKDFRHLEGCYVDWDEVKPLNFYIL